MITIDEDDKPFVPASNFYFERSEAVRSTLEDCSKDELIDLTKQLFRRMESAYMKMDDATCDMAKLIGWSD